MNTVAGFKNASEDWRDDYYDKSFGLHGIGHKVDYEGGVDPDIWKSGRDEILALNKAHGDLIMKELGSETNVTQVTTQFTATSGYIHTLIPIWLMPEILDRSRRKCVLLNSLTKMAVRGLTVTWLVEDYASSNAGFRQEDGSQIEYDDTYTQITRHVKYCYANGRVTGPMQVGARGFINAERQEMLSKTNALRQRIEYELIYGDDSSDPLGFDGLNVEVSTNYINKASAALTIANVRTIIMYAEQGAMTWTATSGGGNIDVIYVDASTYNDIRGLIQAYQRIVNTTTIAFGYTAIDFDGVPVVKVPMMTTVSGSKLLLALDSSVVRIAVALDITMERLAKTNDSNKFMIKWYGCLALLVEKWCGRIYSIG